LASATRRSCRSIEVRWPSGTVQQLRDVNANQTLTVKEPQK
jgi:hypothetical protein